MPKATSSLGRMKHLLDTGIGAVVHFLLLPAHKLILMVASDVFEAMFSFDARNAKAAAAGKVPSGVLTNDEIISNFLHYSRPDRALHEPYQLQFRTNGRAGTKSGLTLQNRRDSAACHEDLTLIEPKRLIARFTGEEEGFRSVCAERPIPERNFGFFYFEMTI
uniref:Uncharacterized protein n=1 Tax=Globodera pallida TaxID=36090 RepID=A0A183BSS8_GLOPA